MTGTSVGDDIVTTGVTAIVQEACVTRAVGAASGDRSLVVQGDLQNLTQYFSRPRYIDTITMPTTRKTIFSKVVTVQTLFGTWFPQGFNRLLGAYGVRFTMVFHLQIAATPFHQGLLAMSWQYHPSATDTTNGTWNRGSLPSACTNLPHVRLDVSSETMACLRVPFLHVEEFLRSTTYDNTPATYGILSLNSLVPALLGAGSTPPTMKLLVHLEDVEFIGAAPQETRIVELQGKMRAEFNNDAYPMSSALHSASTALNFISKGIPSLAGLAGTMSWFAETGAGVLRYFGYSKPLIQDPPMKMFPQHNVQENNVDGPTAAIMLGPLASNQCAVDGTLGGSDVDQMALPYVLQQYSQVFTGSIKPDQPTGTVLYGTHMSPSVFWFRGAGNCNYLVPPAAPNDTHNAVMPSHVCYFASMFRLWRGNFRFRITFVKTPYHGGRVIFNYVPKLLVGSVTTGAQSIIAPDTIQGGPQPFGVSAIFDLRDKNVFEFDVPYSAPVPFLTFTSSMGDVTMSVIDPLVCPTTVAQQVDYLIEVSTSDFTCAIPVAPVFAPMPAASTVYEQSIVQCPFKNNIDEVTIGEKITSLKQLIQLPKWTTTQVFDRYYSAYILPWWYQPQQFTSVPSRSPYPETFGFGGCIACCYSFVRGSTDVHVYAEANSYSNAFQPFSPQISVQVVPWNGGKPAPWNGFWYNTPSSSTNKILSYAKNAIHARIPNYGTVPRYDPGVINRNFTGTVGWLLDKSDTVDAFWTTTPSLTPPSVSTTTGNPSSLPPLNVAGLTINSPWNMSSTEFKIVSSIYISRHAGDDAYASMYIGPPPILLPPATSQYYDRDFDVNIRPGIPGPIPQALAGKPIANAPAPPPPIEDSSAVTPPIASLNAVAISSPPIVSPGARRISPSGC